MDDNAAVLPKDGNGLNKRQHAQIWNRTLADVMKNNDSTDDHRWYAIHVKHRQEKTTSLVLREKGYKEFLPTYKTRRRWRDRIAEMELPLFPGYIFCNVDLNDRRTPILTTPGVIRFIGIGRTPYPIEDSEIAAIQRVIESGVAAEPWPFLTAGAPVRIEHGPLAGLDGVYVKTGNDHKLIVSVTLLQRSVAVQIDRASVVPVAHQPALPVSSSVN